jgi:dTDP-4-amino-4,6-dideoxygalactose transaminase
VSVPLFDPAAEHCLVDDEVEAAITEVLSSGSYVLGPNVQALEREIAGYLGAAHAFGVASGTDALMLSLLATGVGPGDEVVVPAFSFVATAETVLRVGATPVFADVDAASGCMDPTDVAERITGATRALVPVHLYGHPADMDALGKLAAARSLILIEDNAQGFGSRYGGRPTGGMGDASCLSFFPTKTLGGYGDGGMVLTSRPEVAERVRMLRVHGAKEKHRPVTLGFNSRLDELQAAALRVKLRRAGAWHARRRELAARLSHRLAAAGAEVPSEAPGAEHTYGLYVIRVPDRDRVRERLAERGIGTGVYYPKLLPETELFGGSAPGGSGGRYPVAEQLSREVLAIPLFSSMTDEQADEVASAVEAAVG